MVKYVKNENKAKKYYVLECRYDCAFIVSLFGLKENKISFGILKIIKSQCLHIFYMWNVENINETNTFFGFLYGQILKDYCWVAANIGLVTWLLCNELKHEETPFQTIKS